MSDTTAGKTQRQLWWLWLLTLGLAVIWVLYSSQGRIQDLLNQLASLEGEEDAQEWMVVNAELIAQVKMLGSWVLREWVIVIVVGSRFLFERRTAQQRLHVHQNLKPLSRLSRWLPEDKREEWLGDFYEEREQWHRQGYSPLAIRRHTLRRAWQLGRVDELFDANPHGNEMNQSQKGMTQFLIPCGNASKLFEVVEEPFHLLA